MQYVVKGSTGEQRSSDFRAISAVWLYELKAKISEVWGR